MIRLAKNEDPAWTISCEIVTQARRWPSQKYVQYITTMKPATSTLRYDTLEQLRRQTRHALARHA